MSLSIGRVSVGDPETERAPPDPRGARGARGRGMDSVDHLPNPGAAWEVVLDGAARAKSDHFDWEILPAEGQVRFRKLFHGKDEQTVEHFRRGDRKLLWECVQFRENPIRT